MKSNRSLFSPFGLSHHFIIYLLLSRCGRDNLDNVIHNLFKSSEKTERLNKMKQSPLQCRSALNVVTYQLRTYNGQQNIQF